MTDLPMKQQSHGGKQPSAIKAAAATLVILPLFLLYRLFASKMGIWEPWESEILDWGALLHATDGASAILPIARGEFVPIPWLQSFLAMLGASFDGSAAAMRTPWTLLAVVSVGTVSYCYGHIFGVLRGALIGATFGLVPIVLLSASNAAGIIPFASMYSCALATYTLTRYERSSGAAWLAFGLFTGLTMWAGLLPGLAAILYTILGFHIAERASDTTHSKRRSVIAAVLMTISVLLFIAGAPEGVDPNSAGAQVARGVAGYITLPLAGFVFFSPIPVADRSRSAIYRYTGGLIALTVIALPIIQLLTHLSLVDTFAYLIDPQPIVAVAAEGEPFSDLIRIAGFGLFPLTALLFYGMDYLVRTTNEAFTDTDYGSTAVHDAKLLLLSSSAATFVIFAVTLRSSGIILFAMPLSVAATVALSLSDRTYLRWLAGQSTLRRFHAVTIAAMVLILTKDVRGMYHEEMGHPGPRVMIEFLTEGSPLRIPDEYAFGKMRIFVLLWLMIIVVGWLAVPAGYRWWSARRERQANSAVMQALTEWTSAAWLLVASVFLLVLGFMYIPALDTHLSSQSLSSKLESLESAASQLVVQEDARPWSLRDREGLEEFGSASDLRKIFCDAEGRVFATLHAEDLPSYYEDIRAADARDRDDCEAGFHVLYGASKRFALISNEINTDANEMEEGLIADAIVEESEIPADATRFDPPYEFDGKLELIAAQVTPDALVSGEFEVATWWRVKASVSRDWEIFIHVDGPGSRINGDHKVVGGEFPTTRWVPGDIVVDRHEMSVSLFGDAKGEYVVRLGMFIDDDRMTVSPAVSENRVDVGTIEVLWPFGIGRK